jgi:hypothetical protein
VQVETDGPADKRLFEAIKLLVLLGQVDFTLWAFLAQEASVHGEDYIDIEGTRPCLIVCSLSISLRDTLVIVDWCARAILHGMGSASKSAGYDDAVKLLVAGYKDKRI